MNIFKLLFKKKVSYKSPQDFLTQKLTPIAKYLYNGRVLIGAVPVVKDKDICSVVFFVGENSKNLGKFYISVDNVFEWMGVTKKGKKDEKQK